MKILLALSLFLTTAVAALAKDEVCVYDTLINETSALDETTLQQRLQQQLRQQHPQAKQPLQLKNYRRSVSSESGIEEICAEVVINH